MNIQSITKFIESEQVKHTKQVQQVQQPPQTETKSFRFPSLEKLEASLRNVGTLTAEQKREMRLKNCGMDATKIVKRSGYYKDFVFYCDLFRDCKACMGKRIFKYKDKLQVELMNTDKPLFMATINSDVDEKKLRLGHKTNGYIRFPSEDGKDVVLFYKKGKTNYDIIFNDIKQFREDIKVEDINFEDILLTPVGKRISGNILKYTSEDCLAEALPNGDGDSDTEEVEIQTIEIESQDVIFAKGTSKELQKLARDYAILSTIDLLPTEFTLQDCVNARNKALIQGCKKLGIEFTLSHTQKENVDTSMIDWSETQLKTLQMLQIIRNSTGRYINEKHKENIFTRTFELFSEFFDKV